LDLHLRGQCQDCQKISEEVESVCEAHEEENLSHRISVMTVATTLYLASVLLLEIVFYLCVDQEMRLVPK